MFWLTFIAIFKEHTRRSNTECFVWCTCNFAAVYRTFY